MSLIGKSSGSHITNKNNKSISSSIPVSYHFIKLKIWTKYKEQTIFSRTKRSNRFYTSFPILYCSRKLILHFWFYTFSILFPSLRHVSHLKLAMRHYVSALHITIQKPSVQGNFSLVLPVGFAWSSRAFFLLKQNA